MEVAPISLWHTKNFTPPSPVGIRTCLDRSSFAWRNNAEQFGTGSERYHILLKLQGKFIRPIIMASQLLRSGSWALLLGRSLEEALVIVESAS